RAVEHRSDQGELARRAADPTPADRSRGETAPQGGPTLIASLLESPRIIITTYQFTSRSTWGKEPPTISCRALHASVLVPYAIACQLHASQPLPLRATFESPQ